MTKNSLIENIASKRKEIEFWLQTQWTNSSPIYASMDIRDSGSKITPIDTNLFPAGFNNLANNDLKNAVDSIKKVITQSFSAYKHLLIITENHTRNPYYFSNVAMLKKLIQQAGIEVRISNFMGETYIVETHTGESITIEKLERVDQTLKVGHFVPDCILLNNDLTDGIPPILHNITQSILPHPSLGWHQRLKSNYFSQYQKVVQRFTTHFHWDAWHFHPLHLQCAQIDFSTPEGRTRIIPKAQQLFEAIQKKYRQYAIQDQPYIIIKADNGSYGMAVTTIYSPDELLNLSRQKRSHMKKIKGNQPVQSILLQEGIPSTTRWMNQVAEPVLYTIGQEVIGGFYRAHAKRSAKENLNIPGMTLIPMDKVGFKTILNPTNPLNDEQKQFYAYCVVARLGLVAASAENNTVINSLSAA